MFPTNHVVLLQDTLYTQQETRMFNSSSLAAPTATAPLQPQHDVVNILDDDATQSQAPADSQQQTVGTPATAAVARNAAGGRKKGGRGGGGSQSLLLPAKRGGVVVDVDPSSHAAATELAGPDIRALLADRSSLMDEQVRGRVGKGRGQGGEISMRVAQLPLGTNLTSEWSTGVGDCEWP